MSWDNLIRGFQTLHSQDKEEQRIETLEIRWLQMFSPKKICMMYQDAERTHTLRYYFSLFHYNIC